MKDKIKVLLVSPYSAKHTGGIGTWTKIVLDYASKDKEVDLIFLNTSTRLPKRSALNNKLAHLLIGGIDSLRIIIALFVKLMLKRPDVVHYTSSAAFALYKDRIAAGVTTGLFKKKFIIHWRFGRIPEIFNERGREYKNFIKVLNRVNLSLVLDEKSYNVIKDAGYDAELIPNPVSLAIQEVAEKFDIQQSFENRETGIVLFVGHMLPAKGIFELVEACVDCKEVKKLVMIGPFFDESLRERLINIAERRGKAGWLVLAGEKKREEVWQYYKCCNVFCLPSYTEGFPNVVLEAMSFGCPIVATEVGAIPEMLGDGCGIIVEPKQIESLKTAIRRIIKNPDDATKISNKAHEKILSSYTINYVFGKYKSIWKRMSI